MNHKAVNSRSMPRSGWSAGLLASVIVLIFTTHTAYGAPAEEPFLGGYSPVSYFTEGKAEVGSKEFAVTGDDGRLYYLTSQVQVDLFKDNPGKYRPRYDICPYSLVHTGGKLPLDPTNFKVIGGQLLIFHQSKEFGDGLAGWESSELSDEELLKLADGQYRLLTF